MTESLILADSSVWIDHINTGDAHLVSLLRRQRIVLHPMIIGEIALGSIRKRATVLAELEQLPRAIAASHSEVMAMIGWQKLHSCGIGYVDAHLLASARILGGCEIWTRDKQLHTQAERLGLAYAP